MEYYYTLVFAWTPSTQVPVLHLREVLSQEELARYIIIMSLILTSSNSDSFYNRPVMHSLLGIKREGPRLQVEVQGYFVKNLQTSRRFWVKLESLCWTSSSQVAIAWAKDRKRLRHQNGWNSPDTNGPSLSRCSFKHCFRRTYVLFTLIWFQSIPLCLFDSIDARIPCVGQNARSPHAWIELRWIEDPLLAD